jgi:hypothetical protein
MILASAMFEVTMYGLRLRVTVRGSAYAILDKGMSGMRLLKNYTRFFIWSLKFEFLVKSLWW